MGGAPVHLAPKEFDLLVLLAEKHGQTVERSEILARIWAGTFVEEGNITQTVSTLRKTLEVSAEMAGWIRTVPKHGYRFEAPVISRQPEGAGGGAVQRRGGGFRLSPAAVIPLLAIAAAAYVALDLPRLTPPAARVRSVVVLPIEDLTSDKSAGVTCELLMTSVERGAVQVKELTVILGGKPAGDGRAKPGQLARAQAAPQAREGWLAGLVQR
jgi:hypothetical protein